MSSAFRNRSLRLESLENRELFAGDAFAIINGGTLNIVETSGQTGQPQAIEITRTPFGFPGQSIRVRGLENAAGGTTLINGRAFVDFRVPSGNVSVNLGSGNDWVRVNDVTLNNLNVDTGNGRDAVTLGQGMKTTGTATIRTGADDDFVNLFEAQIGNDSLDNLNVYMGTGVDYFYSKSVSVLASVTGNLNLYMSENGLDRDTDTITLEKAKIGGSLTMHTGAGDDTISVNNTIVGNDFLLSTGADADTAKLKDLQVLDDVFANMGAGMDTLDLDNVWADRLEVNGEGDRDTLIRRRVGQVNVFQYAGFEVATI